MRKANQSDGPEGCAEAKHRRLAGQTQRPDKPGFAERARRHREALRGRVHSDSAELIREDRDRDYDNASWSEGA